jgi:hypothetical protein
VSALAEENVNTEEASHVLQQEWKRVKSSDETKYVDDQLIRS